MLNAKRNTTPLSPTEQRIAEVDMRKLAVIVVLGRLSSYGLI
jgi:hypothetical protein